MNNVESKQFWVSGPPVGLVESLVNSGLVNDTNLIAQPENVDNSPKKMIKEKTINRLSGLDKIDKKPKGAKTSRTSIGMLSIPKIDKKSETVTKSCRFAMPSTKLTASMNPYKSPFPLPSETLLNLSRPKSSLEEAILPGNKVPFSRKESQALLARLKEIEEDMRISNKACSTPEKQAEYYEKFLVSYFILMNDIILQLKTYNQDYSLMLIQIKSFFQELLSKLPKMQSDYEKEIAALKAQISSLTEEKRIVEEENKLVKASNSTYCETLAKLKNEVNKANDKIRDISQAKSDLEMENEDIKQKITEGIYRFGKMQELKKKLENDLKESKEETEEYKRQVNNLEAIVKKCEAEGAGFMPLYNKGCAEIARLKAELNDATAEIEEYKAKIRDRAEIGIDPVFSIDDLINTKPNHQKKRQRGLTVSAKLYNKNLQSAGDGKLPKPTNLNIKQIKGNKNISVGNFNVKSVEDMKPKVEEKRGEKLVHEKSKEVIIATESQAVLLTEMPAGSMEIIPISTDDDDGNVEEKPTEEGEEKKQKTPETPIRAASEENKKENVIQINDELQVSDNLPEDYFKVVSNKPIRSQSLISYVYKLLPSKYNFYNQVNDDFIRFGTLPKDAQLKDLSWTLRTVVAVMRDGINAVSGSIVDLTFKQIVFNVMRQYCSNDYIAMTNESCLMTSIIHYRSVSKTIEFFMKFETGEYSIANFKFFSVLFSLAIPTLYPKIETVTNDPDVSDDSLSFTIHTENVDKIAEMFLGVKTFPKERLVKLVKEAPNKEFPRLVSFWDFSINMIEMFNEMHRTFHLSIKNAMMVLGNHTLAKISKPDFLSFIRILFPRIDDDEIKRMWMNVSAAAGACNADEVSPYVFFDWIGDNNEIVDAIIKLPKCVDFDAKFKQMSQKSEHLFSFIKTRYITFIPKMILHLRDEVREKIMPSVFKMRNSILRCDLCGCFMFYRYFLQTIDLMETQNNPFIYFSPNVTNEEMDKLMEFMKLREKITAMSVDVEEQKI